LVAAWARHPATRPPLPADEDEDLLARRLVAQRCLYGVDRNPMAVDLARLSLWLATLARDHEFTFLDHALRVGDSLVGLSRDQVTRLDWRDEAQGTLFGGIVRERLQAAVAARRDIRTAGDDVALFEQEQRLAIAEKHLSELRLAGDAVIAVHFGAERDRARHQALERLRDTATNTVALWAALRAAAATLATAAHPVRPFHWHLEFPEVFAGAAPGFDAIVGNPPFAGKNTMLGSHREGYLLWLQTANREVHGNSDLVAHFFRRAFDLLQSGGCFGLIATNTVGQGDTRESGLRWLLAHGGSIARATRRLTWPGEAAVVVSVVHVIRGALPPGTLAILDGREVRRISAYLVEGDLDASPTRLSANVGKAHIGCVLLGMGFTFDDEAVAAGRTASPVAEIKRLICEDERNEKRILPYLGGEEVNRSPSHQHRRYAIDFRDFPLGRREMPLSWAKMDGSAKAHCKMEGFVPLDYPDPVAEDWPSLLSIVERLVKPERQNDKREIRRRRWWQFGEKQIGMRQAVDGLDFVLVITQTSPHLAVAKIPGGYIYDQKLIVLPDARATNFGIYQCRVHEIWARAFAATMKDDLSYTPSDCFLPFPTPVDHFEDAALDDAATKYYGHRAATMTARGEGMTRTYNRLHDSVERGPDIYRLRELHHTMDQAVLRAYGWDDLAAKAALEFLDDTSEPDHRYQGRLFWPAPFRDEVLARLLDLNRARAEEERRLGLAPRGGADEDAVETEDA
jgi:hypothetical protein